MAKGAKTTSKSSVPSWLSTPLQGLTGQITQAGAVDPQSRIAGTNPLLDKAMGTLSGDPYAQAREMIAGGANGGGSVGFHATSDYMDNYKNPYLKDILDTSLADFDEGAGRQTAQADLDIAGAGAFNGSGSSITKSLLGGELSRGRGALSAGIRSDAFNTAANLGQGDATRATSTDATNAQLAESAAARRMQGGGLLANLTSQELGQQFQYGDYQRQLENERLNADWTNLAKQSALYQPLGSLFQTQTQTTKPGALDYISSGAGLASMFFSDERLKTDIQRIGTRPDGLGVYLYRYIWGPMLFVGVMAQEVLKVRPEAVGVHPSGFLMVNYGAL